MSEQDLIPIMNEGCRIEANLDINRVRGNLHITGHAHSDLVDIWMKHKLNMDLSHIIHNFVFGNISDNKDAFVPLNNYHTITQPSYVRQINEKISKNDYVNEQHRGHEHTIDKMKISYEVS